MSTSDARSRDGPTSGILSELGEIAYFVHDRFGDPLVVTDDDIAGTFTFVRALEDCERPEDLTSANIGKTWLIT